ncbi:cupin domain-containing protein [Actinoplanes solisilvae]|uniref:cupin domain-containing protein n=1 Tax=Actinoplanes solisilvae TaxID=2486853 RepID=UPI0013E36579|nr:cupin domain-containing protein [Actinoplanes solisilvae]
MSKQHRLRIFATGATMAAAASLGLSSPAQATPPGSGVVGITLSQTTVGHTDYVVRKITIPPGQSTGWHYHDGTLFGWLQQGTLSHFDATCKSDGIYPTGSFIQEPHGANHVHIGINKGRKPVVLKVLYVLPAGSPLSEDAPNPGCEFD